MIVNKIVLNVYMLYLNELCILILRLYFGGFNGVGIYNLWDIWCVVDYFLKFGGLV